ncbi:MAG: class I SAM-dependent methyltransferase [Hyphomicrobiales bacterium]|nr:class I SAM-dependent methyltransferase [Hyphomicrobiales bacterium]
MTPTFFNWFYAWRVKGPLARRFTEIYRKNLFGGGESISGPGSDLVQTEEIRRLLPDLFNRYAIASILDAACGDFFWMKHVCLDDLSYIGVDVVAPMIALNANRYGGGKVEFRLLDVTTQPVPRVDLILCRDLLVHLDYSAAKRAIANFRASGSAYLLTTTFPAHDNAQLDGIWRPLNLQAEPFNFPPPLELINENCSENEGIYRDKSLGLWRLQELPAGG